MQVIFLFFFLALTTLLQADKLTDTMWNFSLNTPKNWKYQKSSELVLLAHDKIAGLILVYPHKLTKKSALKELMYMGLHEDEGYLQLQGKLKKFMQDGYKANYIGMYQMQVVKAKAFGRVFAANGGITVIVMSTPEAFSQALEDAGKSIVKSLKANKQKIQSGTQNSGDVQKIFIGKWSYYSKYRESHVYLYSNGTYADNSSSSFTNSDTSVGTTWGTASDSQNHGHWRAQGNAEQGEIIFTLPNGEKSVYPYRVHIENGRTYWSEYYFGERLYSRSPLQ